MKTCLLNYLYIDVIIAIQFTSESRIFVSFFPLFFVIWIYNVVHTCTMYTTYLYLFVYMYIVQHPINFYHRLGVCIHKKGGGVVCIRKKPQSSCEKRNLTFMLVQHPSVCRHLYWHWISSYQEERGGIPLTDLTPPHCCTCPKTGLWYPTSYVMVRGDCSFCWYWLKLYYYCLNFLLIMYVLYLNNDGRVISK